MARGDAKVDPRPIVLAHYRSLVDVSTGRQRLRDHAWLEGVPAVVGLVTAGAGVTLPQLPAQAC